MSQPLRPRHIPQRTCIACRQEEGKRTLIRVVRTPEGRVVVDASGKANGRGAYLHRDPACWVKALKGATISNALKLTPAREDVDALKAFGMTLPAVEGGTFVDSNPVKAPDRRDPGRADGEGAR